MKFKLLAICFLFFCSAYAQKIELLKTYDHKNLNGQTLKIYSETGIVALTVYQANMIKISYLKDENQKPDSSYLVISEPKETMFKVSQNLDDIFLTTDSLIVIINKLNFSIKFLNRDEKLLSVNTNAFEIIDSIRQLNFTISSNEAIYGLGSRAIPLNKSGYRLENYRQPHHNYAYDEENLNLLVPFFSSDKGYGIYFDKKGTGYFDIGKTDQTQFQYSTQRGGLSYYFISGTPNQLLKSYTWLTGRQPLPLH